MQNKQTVDLKDQKIKDLLNIDMECVIEKYKNGEISEDECLVGCSPFFRAFKDIQNENNESTLGYVYIIEDQNGNIKFGRSINPKSRVRCLETQGNLTIKRRFISQKLIGYREIEKDFHKKFQVKRLKGEWFSVEFDIALNYVKEIENNLSCVDTKWL